ncbi:hypothetical protein [Prosthecobacter sp.]|uniref:hypothetical protein n=1 Tax=Prosthecobacter sp. TaxID=1965333 RepID=UPI002486F19C|nr:hypothetical protein [Prosthecobacter sp.]MDI1312435.1 hypothetical protein [Prosthecobacter sp.]
MNATDFKNHITKIRPGDAIASITPQRNFNILAYSYGEAAEMLSKHIGEEGFYKDLAIHPICFLYRHSLELSFKQIVWDGRRLLGEKARVEELCRSHEIQSLWTEIEAIMNAVWPELPFPEAALILREVVAWFHGADPGSLAFRYPFDKKLQGNLTELSHINLSTLVEAMEISTRFLGGVASAVSEYLSAQRNTW